jgi:Tfp pilus assembly PilM family ATPase
LPDKELAIPYPANNYNWNFQVVSKKPKEREHEQEIF